MRENLLVGLRDLGRPSHHGPTELDRPFDLWVYADDCDAAIERLRSGGVQIVAEPEDQPWGERMARVQDPEGNRVIVAARGLAER